MSSNRYSRPGQPPTPPPPTKLEYGLHHVARHNAGHAGYAQNQPGEQDTSNLAYQAPNTIEPGINYHADNYGQTGLHPHDAYGQAAHPNPYEDVSSRTPTTPRSNATSDSARRTRSGRVIRTDSPMSSIRDDSSRVTKSPRSAKKARKDKAAKVQLRAPLSELTKDSALPVKDMRAHIHRPTALRIREAKDRQEKKGKGNKGVPRPMNSFMLYRSAYAERCKEWALQHNHQVVSSISGASWPLEPAEIREFYTSLAEEEREEHKKAHPTYKFAPSKPANALAKEDIYDEKEFSDNDPDGEYAPSGRIVKQNRRNETHATYQKTKQYGGNYPRTVPSNTATSNWSIITGPERPMPSQYQMQQYHAQQFHPQQYQPQQYQPQQYQSPQYQSQPYPNQYFVAPAPQPYQYTGEEEVEDIRMTLNPTPSMSGHGLVSLPGGGHQDLVQSRTETPVHTYEQPHMGGNFLNTNTMLYPDHNGSHTNPEFEMSAGQESHFSESFQPVAPQAVMTQPDAEEWRLDPHLAEAFDEYGQYLNE